jgi:ribonuclease HII
MIEETALLGRGEIVAGLDEVGRGALAGPLSVGVVVVRDAAPAPDGVADSKQLTPRQRSNLEAPIKSWASDWGIGSVLASEIDQWGLSWALAVAADRALSTLRVTPTHLLIDGPRNVLRPVASFNFDRSDVPEIKHALAPATMIIKGDQSCQSIAAAAILAKVHRDRLMVGFSGTFPEYGWDRNMGYGSPRHLAALRRLGPCELHRRSWRLPLREVGDTA